MSVRIKRIPSVSSSKASSMRAVQLVGLQGNKFVKLKNVILVRKNCIRNKKILEAKWVKSRKKDVLGIISHPNLCKCPTVPYIKAWCHPYRDPDQFLNKEIPRLLLSESDFVDSLYVRHRNRPSKKWDYFYFTMGGQKSGKRKGFDIFLRLLPVLAKLKMKGLVVNYTNKELYFSNSKEKQIWKTNKNFISYAHQSFSPTKVAKVMAESRFGLFPNISDCSPLLLTESLLRDIPVLVNYDILGGWKYVNEHTGRFFYDGKNKENEETIRELIDIKFNPKKWFLSNYGFENSAKKLARFGRKLFKSFRDCRMVCFEGLAHLLARFV